MAKPIKQPIVETQWHELNVATSSGSYSYFTWSGPTSKKSLELVAPEKADLFSVTAPSTTSNFSVVSRIDQLSQDVDGTTLYSTYTGSAKSNDKLKISDAGVIGDALFTNISGVEVLMLQGAGNYDVTLAAEAEQAGFVDVIGGLGNDRLDASGYTTLGIELDGGAGDDSLIGGMGADTMIGGLGADVIALEAGGNDVVVFSSVLDGSAPGSAGGEFSGFDTVTGFEAGMDQVDLRFAEADRLETSASSLSSVDAVLSAMNAAIPADATYVEGDVVTFFITNGNDKGLYAGTVSDANADPAVFSPVFMASGVSCLGVFVGPPVIVAPVIEEPVLPPADEPQGATVTDPLFPPVDGSI